MSHYLRFQRSLPKDKRPALAVAQKEESLNMTSAIWFAWGVLLNSGIGEGEKDNMYNVPKKNLEPFPEEARL